MEADGGRSGHGKGNSFTAVCGRIFAVGFTQRVGRGGGLVGADESRSFLRTTLFVSRNIFSANKMAFNVPLVISYSVNRTEQKPTGATCVLTSNALLIDTPTGIAAIL